MDFGPRREVSISGRPPDAHHPAHHAAIRQRVRTERAALQKACLPVREESHLPRQRDRSHDPTSAGSGQQRAAPPNPPRHFRLSRADKRAVHAVHHPRPVVRPSNDRYRVLDGAGLALLRREQDPDFAARLSARLSSELRALGIADAAETEQSGDPASNSRMRTVHQRKISRC